MKRRRKDLQSMPRNNSAPTRSPTAHVFTLPKAQPAFSICIYIREREREYVCALVCLVAYCNDVVCIVSDGSSPILGSSQLCVPVDATMPTKANRVG